jgi:paraquat-inducible protein B
MTDAPPPVSISPVRKAFLSGASVIWLLPLMALCVALWVAWSSFNERGPLIVIEFENGAGISAGETELKFRDINIGVVEKVGFSEGLSKVKAYVRIEKEVAPFVDEGAIFWIVTPEVTAQGVTGLSTVLSGVYIEGSWDETIGTPQDLFQGASSAPLIRPGETGLQIAFRTGPEGQLTDNSPILYKGIEVGRIGEASIPPRGNFAIVEALIYEEHRSLVNQSTRFWDTSGFEVSIGPAGAEINFSSLATLVGGGITFDTFVSGGGIVQDGTVFEIFPDKETARSSLFNASEVDPLKLEVIFEDNLAGLVIGAPVEFSGITIGSVENMSGVVDFDQFGDSRVRLSVILSIQPARLGLPGEVSAEAALSLLQGRVLTGLRARLASASLLTGGLKVEMIDVPDAPPARLVQGVNGPAVMPTTASETTDAAATVEGVFNRINSLPIEELLNSAISLMNSADTLISSDDLKNTPSDVRALLGDISNLVTSQDVQNIPVALNATLTRVETLVAQLEQQQLAERLVAALDGVSNVTEQIGTSVEGVPALLASIGAIADKAQALEVEELITQTSDVLTSVSTLVSSDDLAALPVGLRAALDQVNTALTDLRAGGAVEDLNQTLASARAAAENVAATTKDLPALTEQLKTVLDNASSAAGSIATSAEGVPALVAQIQSIAAKADELEFQELFTELTNLTRSADAVIGTDDAIALPGALKRALDEVNYTLQTLREGGAVENVNRTLTSARNAADTIAVTAQDLPQIVERLTRLFAQAGSTIEGYNKGDEISRSAQETLRDIQKAADALSSLARSIERNPNSLLLGR